MRIHTDNLTTGDLMDAAKIARVEIDWTSHGSRSRDHAFEVRLTGESRRRPNSGQYGATRDAYAATWDQWGVFLAELFQRDATATIPSAYRDGEAFANHTGDRSGAPEVVMTADGYAEEFKSYGWPEDAHGDHRWEHAGRGREQSCTSARQCGAGRA